MGQVFVVLRSDRDLRNDIRYWQLCSVFRRDNIVLWQIIFVYLASSFLLVIARCFILLLSFIIVAVTVFAHRHLSSTL